jgi:branched-subunit amino acid ABC-type transport system permease component
VSTQEDLGQPALAGINGSKHVESLTLGHWSALDTADCQGNTNSTQASVRNDYKLNTKNELSCKDLSPASSTYQALAEGVEDFQLRYAQANPGTQTIQWKTANQVTDMSQVLATFALILIINESVRMIWGTDLPLAAPAALSGPVELLPGLFYPSYRLLIIGVGLVIAGLLYLAVTRTRVGAWVRAGASNREMAMAMGINIRWLFTLVFGLGAALCAVAGALLGPLLAVQVGMGESVLILAFVVIVIGGIGSIWGAFVGSLLVGFVDTFGRTLMPALFRELFPPQVASAAGPAVASIMVYLLMAVVLFVKPQGLFAKR